MKSPVIKNVIPIILLFASLVLYSCAGSPGDVYLEYTWAYTPQYFLDMNPSTPQTVYNGQYFRTDSGSYYMEYIAWDGSGWWMIYTLTENPGEPFFTKGQDALFEIFLSSSGPGFYKWQSASGDPEITSIENSQKTNRNMSTTKPSDGGQLVPVSTQEVTKSGVTLKIEYGPK